MVFEIVSVTGINCKAWNHGIGNSWFMNKYVLNIRGLE